MSLSCEPTTCPDQKRLTDEGLIDFIEESAAKDKIECIDLKNALSSNITLQSIYHLKQFRKLRSLSIHEHQLNQSINCEPDSDKVNENLKNLTVEQDLLPDLCENSNYSLFTLSWLYPNVENLNISAMIFYEKDINKTTKWRENIKVLQCEIDSIRRLNKVCKIFPNLENLIVLWDINDFSLPSFEDDLMIEKSKIQHLEIDCSHHISENTIRKLITHFPELTHFKIILNRINNFWKKLIEESNVNILVQKRVLSPRGTAGIGSIGSMEHTIFQRTLFKSIRTLPD